MSRERIRLAAYAGIIGVLAVARILGWLTPDQEEQIVTAVTAGAHLLAAILLAVAAGHVTPDSWSHIRRVAYAAVAAAFAALAALGWISPDTIETTLAVLTQVLDVAAVVLLGTAAVKVPTENYTPERARPSTI